MRSQGKIQPSSVNKIGTLLVILIISTPIAVRSQQTVKGEVRYSGDSSLLPGVTILELHTNNKISTDADGKFSIVCTKVNPTLEFSFIGLRTVQDFETERYMQIYLEDDPDLKKEKVRMGMYPSYTSIGINTGVAYTPIGVNIRNALPVLFVIKMLTTTEVTYRTDLSDNYFFDVRMRKDRLVDFRVNARYINLHLMYNKRRISTDREQWNTEDFLITPELQWDGILLRLGYGRQAFNNIETLKSNKGFHFGIGKLFRGQAVATATATKWNHYWQTEFQFQKGFKKSDFEVGVRLQTLDRYRELDLLLLYRIHY